MKTIIKLLTILTFFSCKAQNIVPLYNEDTNPNVILNINNYYKDVDNDFNPYVGTWKWEDGNNSLTIIFNKVVHSTDGDGDYDDFLVGEYQYVENGNMLVNSYPELMLNDGINTPNIVNQDPWLNNIVSESIRTENRGFPPCPECAPNTRFIFMSISDPTRTNILGKIRMARFVENGIEKIRMRVTTTYVDNYTQDYSGPIHLTIPENSILTLTKVD